MENMQHYTAVQLLCLRVMSITAKEESVLTRLQQMPGLTDREPAEAMGSHLLDTARRLADMVDCYALIHF